MRSRRLPEPGTLAFTPAITFVACLGERLWMAASMALYFRDPVWTLLMVLGGIGTAVALAICAFAVDATSRTFSATQNGNALRFSVRVFGALFVIAAYLVSYLISIVFAFHPATLMVTAPLLALGAVTGIISGVAVGGFVIAADAGRRRLSGA